MCNLHPNLHLSGIFFSFVEKTVAQINYPEPTPDRRDHQHRGNSTIKRSFELHIGFPPEAIIQLKMATLKKYQQLIYFPRSL